jgi:hypothetical protein
MVSYAAASPSAQVTSVQQNASAPTADFQQAANAALDPAAIALVRSLHRPDAASGNKGLGREFDNLPVCPPGFKTCTVALGKFTCIPDDQDCKGN